jgi:hypothetical protein
VNIGTNDVLHFSKAKKKDFGLYHKEMINEELDMFYLL